MPDRTLKESTYAKATVDEKVVWARVALAINSPNVEEAVQEALTALEEELQRARDALRWKPIDENTPYDTILLFMSHDGNVRQDFIYDEGLERVKKSYMGWMYVPEYNTPEEK